MAMARAAQVVGGVVAIVLMFHDLAMAQKPVVTEEAVVQTSMGAFEIGLYRKDAPKTVENFVQLAKKKFFDGMRVHRVAKGFVIQTGDDKSKNPTKMNEWGTGGSSIYPHKAFDRRTNKMETMYTFEDELDSSTQSYKEGYTTGVVAMANTGAPGTNTSQFFILLTDHSGLPPSYTIFGKVTKGMDIVAKIGAVDVVPQMGPTDGRPKTDIFLKKVTIRPVPHPTKD
jgi:cyclophilin family peptidyl-prolyl cis-trans isomerase